MATTGTCPKRKSRVQAVRAGQHQTLCVDGSPAGTAAGGVQVLPRGMGDPPCLHGSHGLALHIMGPQGHADKHQWGPW